MLSSVYIELGLPQQGPSQEFEILGHNTRSRIIIFAPIATILHEAIDWKILLKFVNIL